MNRKLTYVHLCEILGVHTTQARMKFMFYIPTQGDLQAIVSLLAPFDIVFEAPLMYPATLYDKPAYWLPKAISQHLSVVERDYPDRIYFQPTDGKIYMKGGQRYIKLIAESKKLNAYHTAQSLSEALKAYRGFVTSSTLGIV